MAGETTASTLANIQQDVWTNIFYKGIGNPRPGITLATEHQLGSAVAGDVVKFPVIPAFSATEAADTVATTFSAVSPADIQAAAFELHVGVNLSNFGSVTSPIKTAEMLGEQMVAGLLDKLSAKIVSAALADTTLTVGSTTTDIGTDLSYLHTARKALGAHQGLLKGWILTPELHNLVMNNITDASSYGGREVIVNGAPAPMLFGGPAFQDPNPTTDKAALIVEGGLHFAVLQAPTLRVAYDPDTRSEKAVMTLVAAVKSTALGSVGNVLMLHDQDDDGIAG